MNISSCDSGLVAVVGADVSKIRILVDTMLAEKVYQHSMRGFAQIVCPMASGCHKCSKKFVDVLVCKPKSCSKATADCDSMVVYLIEQPSRRQLKYNSFVLFSSGMPLSKH